MKYQYNINLCIADESKRRTINLKTFQVEFEKAVAHFNTVSAHARNPKRILDIDVRERDIILTLESNSPLDTPTHGLRTFSTFLVNSSFGHRAVTGRKLFRGEAELVEDSTNSTATGPELIKILSEIIIENREEDRDLLERITELLIEWRKKR